MEDDNILHVMKLFNQYKSYVTENEGIDVEFPEYKIDFGDGNDSPFGKDSNSSNKSRNKGRT